MQLRLHCMSVIKTQWKTGRVSGYLLPVQYEQGVIKDI